MSPSPAFLALCQQAQYLLDVKRPLDAIPLLRQAVALEPESIRPYELLAWAQISLNRWRDAQTFAEKIIALEPGDSTGYQLQSLIYLHRGLWYRPRASKAAEEAVRLSPDSPYTLRFLFDVQLARGKTKQAALTASRIRALAPNSAESHSILGRLAFQKSKWPEVEAHALKALAMNPQDGYAFNLLGAALLRQGKTLEAMERLKESLRINPTQKTTQRNLFLANDKMIKEAMPKWLYLPGLGYLGIGVVSGELSKRPSPNVALIADLKIFAWISLGLFFVGIFYWSWWDKRRRPELYTLNLSVRRRFARAFFENPFVRLFYLALGVGVVLVVVGHSILEPAFTRWHVFALLWLMEILLCMPYGLKVFRSFWSGGERE